MSVAHANSGRQAPLGRLWRPAEGKRCGGARSSLLHNPIVLPAGIMKFAALMFAFVASCNLSGPSETQTSTTIKNGTETGEDCGGAACAPCQQ